MKTSTGRQMTEAQRKVISNQNRNFVRFIVFCHQNNESFANSFFPRESERINIFPPATPLTIDTFTARHTHKVNPQTDRLGYTLSGEKMSGLYFIGFFFVGGKFRHLEAFSSLSPDQNFKFVTFPPNFLNVPDKI